MLLFDIMIKNYGSGEMMLNIAICEDYEIIQKQLENILVSYFNKKQVEIRISIFSDGKSLLDTCDSIVFTLIFMDIDLGEDNGIEVMKQIRTNYNTPINVIFVTSYTEYRQQALSLHTFEYIVKPFKNNEVENVLDDLLCWIDINNEKEVIKIKLKTIEGIISLNSNEILYLESVNRRIEIVTLTAKYHMYGKIKSIYEIFDKNKFVIPHISFIVNLENVKLYFKSTNLIEMVNGKNIPVSQLKVQEFRNKYISFLNEYQSDAV